MEIVFSKENIRQAAATCVQRFGEARVIAFHGEMGAGKTTFIKSICDVLGVKETVSSPTFSIINQYLDKDHQPVFHLDLYRLKSEEEALMAGIEECFYSGHWCMVEWPEKAPGLFPENALHCYITTLPDNERKLQIKL